MIKNNSGTNVDAGNKSYLRNNAGADNRSGPQYQWDGLQQELTRAPGGLTILDPGFYLLTKMNFVGDALAGETVYQNNCARCHGVKGDGNGIDEQAQAFNIPGFMNRYTRSSFVAFASSGSHDGASDFSTLTSKQIDDVFARLRGFSGIPGYYLQNPTGSNSDVHSLSDVQLAKIDGNNSKGYSVLLIRALNSGNADDIVFTPSVGQYQFNINLSDNDDLNSIGSVNQTLTFKPK
jgi:mono/diheme cytochrome c family protein